MTESERRLLSALAQVCVRYMLIRDELYHGFEHAGETAVELLAEYGLVERTPTGGKWTEAGVAFLRSEIGHYPSPTA
jgi:hypothetical protein